MTDLRTVAQAVIDVWEANGVLLDWVDEDVAIIEALRQALDAPVEVADTQYKCFKDFGDGDIGFSWLTDSDMKVMYNWKKCSPEEKRNLYTTPPSLDALIAEIDRLHRYNFFNNGVLVFDEVEVEAILDKHRGVK